jgi:putative transposase
MLVDTLGLLLVVVVSAASVQDTDGAEYIIRETADRWPRLQKILVDQGYAAWLVDWVQRWYDFAVEIVLRPLEKREFVVQPQRWKAERTLGWLDWYRILSKEYERTTESSESNIYLASIRLMLRRLTRPPS